MKSRTSNDVDLKSETNKEADKARMLLGAKLVVSPLLNFECLKCLKRDLHHTVYMQISCAVRTIRMFCMIKIISFMSFK